MRAYLRCTYTGAFCREDFALAVELLLSLFVGPPFVAGAPFFSFTDIEREETDDGMPESPLLLQPDVGHTNPKPKALNPKL